MKRIFRFYNISWCVDFCEGINKKELELLADYFIEVGESKHIDFQVKLINVRYENIEEIIRYGEQITIHSSKKPQVHEEGAVLDDGLVRSIYNFTTQSVYHINYIDEVVCVYNEDIRSLSKDYVRVVRDLVKIYMEEKNEAVMVHAAAVEKNGKGYMLVGTKGSGKTTISLNLLYNYKCAEITRDRAFLVKENEEYFILGWPNYYNLTYRTMHSFNILKKLLPEACCSMCEDELDRITEKRQCLPDEIGIISRKRKVKLFEIVFLNNRNINENVIISDVLAASSYTPYDRNYINWFSRCTKRKEKETKAINMYKELLEKKHKLVSWKEINEAVLAILER